MCQHEVYVSSFTTSKLVDGIAHDINMNSVGDYYRGCGVSFTYVAANIVHAVMTMRGSSLTALSWALLHRRGCGLQLSEMQDKQISHAQDRSQLWLPCCSSPYPAPIIRILISFISGRNREPENTELVSDVTSRLRTNAALTDHHVHEMPDMETWGIVHGFYFIFISLILDLAIITSHCINLWLIYGSVSCVCICASGR